MKLIEAIRLACEFLNFDDCIAEIDEYIDQAYSDQFAFSSAVQKKMAKFLTLGNVVASRIADEYIPLIKSETKKTDSDKKVLYTNFLSMPIEIMSAFQKSRGKVVKPYMSSNACYLNAENEEYVINYRCLPNTMVDFADEIDLPFFLLKKTFAYALASDMCLTQNNFEESDMWNKRFEQAIKSNLKHFAPRYFKSRRLV